MKSASKQTFALQERLKAAVSGGQLEKTKKLLLSGVDPSFESSKCLSIALARNYEQIGRLLLQHGAHVNDIVYQQFGEILPAGSAEHSFQWHQSAPLREEWKLALLIEFMEESSYRLIYNAISHPPTLRLMLTKGVNPSLHRDPTARDWPVLATAIFRALPESALILLDAGANPFVELRPAYLDSSRDLELNRLPMTLLHLAARRSQLVAVVRRLLSLGVPHSTTSFPPLRVAIRNRSLESARLLIDAGAHCDACPGRIVKHAMEEEAYAIIPDLILRGVYTLSATEARALMQRGYPNPNCIVAFLKLFGPLPIGVFGPRVDEEIANACMALAPRKLL